ncbi:MAG: adenylyltransferase/cytidyltransferase family protein [Alphaproteobacteria bacterium]|nr:adenylyltransferase/cytidyltransferase family protein [Alphaproteobacteria bacterium]
MVSYPRVTTPDGERNCRDKIKTVEDLAVILAGLKASGATVAHCHGTFDLMHPGHIRHIAEARRQAGILVVTITADRFINKGPGRPIFNEGLRAESLASLEMVDFVAILPHPTAIEGIRLLKPDVYIKGSEYIHPGNDLTGKIHDEVENVHAVGGRVHYTDDITFSSSKLINSHFSFFSPETEQWLKEFRSRHSGDAVGEWLNKLAGFKVLVIGETIIDEYVFCHGLGKAAKDPILAFNYKTTETYAGGSLAVANHVAGFTNEISIVTLLGDTERREEFIRSALKPHVTLNAVTQKSAPTLHKRRFVDDHTGNKMFELYMMEDGPLAEESEAALLTALERELPLADVVIVPDYGHGMLTRKAVELICAKAKFLVVNTQANAGNRGFNLISKYRRADYVCIAGHELELETRMLNATYREHLEAIGQRMDCPNFTITMGRAGTLHFTRGQGFTEAPAFATKVVDRVGAGDAVLSVTGMLLAAGAPWDVIGLVANVAGAEMVGDLGNRVSLDKGRLAKHIASLLK